MDPTIFVSACKHACPPSASASQRMLGGSPRAAWQGFKYLGYAIDRVGDLLKLVHFNDSKGDCGSCVDRHAFVCFGKINKEVLVVGCANIGFRC